VAPVADHLDAVVVAGRVQPRRVERRQPAAGEPHGDDRGLDAPRIVRTRVVAPAPVGGHLHDLLAADPAREVEVVDRRVEEQRRGVTLRPGRRGSLGDQRVKGSEPEEADASDGPVHHGSARRGVPGVVAAVEPELDQRAGSLDALRQIDRRGEIVREWLLAQHRQLSGDGRVDHRGVRVGRCGDHDGVGSAERVFERRRTAADARGDLSGAVGIGVDHEHLLDVRHQRQQAGVLAAHDPGADHRDLHRLTPSTAARSAASPIAAASAGGSHDESCSTMSHPE
jgi:hypothetical protein